MLLPAPLYDDSDCLDVPSIRGKRAKVRKWGCWRWVDILLTAAQSSRPVLARPSPPQAAWRARSPQVQPWLWWGQPCWVSPLPVCRSWAGGPVMWPQHRRRRAHDRWPRSRRPRHTRALPLCSMSPRTRPGSQWVRSPGLPGPRSTRAVGVRGGWARQWQDPGCIRPQVARSW